MALVPVVALVPALVLVLVPALVLVLVPALVPVLELELVPALVPVPVDLHRASAPVYFRGLKNLFFFHSEAYQASCFSEAGLTADQGPQDH
ncbi:hypothetical protein [Endozoicomonas sp. 8E]|uniref:hypothetical protein n=1 Tax=Endozoicomonas sp. 8E TaxID=3035692 RepID=UPI0029392AFE|nr:hypothetical protein [Endozoicomonas sp. 8E]WOG26774.1 hypothetical protein P6910_19825 [Endozoicomonas sp. 8E]